jgi:hypothetical protein
VAFRVTLGAAAGAAAGLATKETQMSRTLPFALAASALVFAGAAPAFAQPGGGSCFRMSQLQSTRADGDKRIYARVNVNDYYRIDLAYRCTSLPYADRGLVMTPAGGNDLICSPIDLDLKVNDHGALEPCFIKSITKLTPEEAAAIPKRSKP